ncbi:MAG TPA: AAA family ATPase [Terriglobales bacterium]|nr:AAA family ATPase [Terriglobales bacterium]
MELDPNKLRVTPTELEPDFRRVVSVATTPVTKLIILRGPSAVGKSTVAKALMERTPRPTVLVELDYYRFGFVNPPKRDLNLEYELSGSDAMTALRLGFDVIFDGNFTSSAHDPFLEELFRAHPKENYLFYLDASLTETMRRHGTKANPRISTEKMREVYKNASPTGREEEVVIPEDSSLEQTVEQIVRTTAICN